MGFLLTYDIQQSRSEVWFAFSNHCWGGGRSALQVMVLFWPAISASLVLSGVTAHIFPSKKKRFILPYIWRDRLVHSAVFNVSRRWGAARTSKTVIKKVWMYGIMNFSLSTVFLNGTQGIVLSFFPLLSMISSMPISEEGLRSMHWRVYVMA